MSEKCESLALILDTSAIIKNVRLEKLSTTVFTVPEVLAEAKDYQSRLNLSLQFVDIKTRHPTDDAVKRICEFSKLTGDYPALSVTDIKILALTYMLEVERAGTASHLKSVPTPVASEPKKRIASKNQKSSTIVENEQPETLKEKTDMANSPNLGTSDIDDDDGEWITPQNVVQIRARDAGMAMDMKNLKADSLKDIKVACITTDFAMQNVLLQMGLHLLSFDGMLIRTIKNYVMRCHACFKATSDLSKKFCPSCGNTTLIKTTVSVDENGEMHYHLKKNFQYRLRGNRFPIPAPQGGREKNIILREDQKEFQRGIKSRERQKEKEAMSNSLSVFDPEYVPRLLESNVYALEKINIQKKQLHGPVVGLGRHNPNEVKKRTGNKKS